MLIAEPLLLGALQSARRLPVALERAGLDVTPGTPVALVVVVLTLVVVVA